MSVLLTATFTRLDGTPASGTVRVTPSRSPIMDPEGQIIISGPQTFSLDKDGKLNAEIQASNDPDLGAPFTYTIDVHLTHATWKIARVWIPHGTPSVDLSTIADYTPLPGEPTRLVTIPADGVDGQVLVWDGAGFTWMDVPQGPKGDPGEVTTAALTAALAGKVTGITGPGRPDIPSTTDLTAAELTALPVGARYISTTGPQGAWEWQKRGTTWVVTSGDTGRISIAGMLNTGWVPANANAAWIRKTPHSLELQLGPIDTTASTSSVAINGGLPAWAQFHPQDTTWRIRSGSLVLTRTGSAYAGTYVTGPTEKEATVSMITQLFTPLNPNLWPVTLDPLTKG